MKESPSLMSGWQKRYIILKDNKFSYMNNKNQKSPDGVINFDVF